MIFAIVLLLLGRVVAQSFETGGLLGAGGKDYDLEFTY